MNNRIAAILFVVGAVEAFPVASRAELDASVATDARHRCQALNSRLDTAADGQAVEVDLGVGGPEAPATLQGGTVTVRFGGPVPAAFHTSSVQYRIWNDDWLDRWVTQMPECEAEPCVRDWFELVADLEAGVDLPGLAAVHLRLTRAQDLPPVSQVCLDVSFRRRPQGAPFDGPEPVSNAPKEGTPSSASDALAAPAAPSSDRGSERRDAQASGVENRDRAPRADGGTCQITHRTQSRGPWFVVFGASLVLAVRKRNTKRAAHELSA